MRGKLVLVLAALPLLRITPADAGKTTIIHTQNIPNKDHPRGCGENLKLPPDDAAKAGSPPRMRGKLTDNLSDGMEDGITPADAGKTHSDGWSGCRS